MYGITDLSLGEAEARRLRDQRAQIPLALETDPFALAHEVRELAEVLVAHAAVDQSNDASWMLPLKALVHILRPRHRGGPRDHDRGFLRRSTTVLDADPPVQAVVVRAETQDLRDPQSEAVLAHEGDLAATRRRQVHRIRGDGEVHDVRRLPSTFHRHATGAKQIGHDHRLRAPELQIPGG